MPAYFGPIEEQTTENQYFRKVIYTGQHMQLVLMCLQPGEEIGNEVHDNVDQFFRVEQGTAKFVINGSEEHLVRANEAAIIPAGTFHNVINASKSRRLRLYTIYTPPNHPADRAQKTKAEADAAEHEHAH